MKDMIIKVKATINVGYGVQTVYQTFRSENEYRKYSRNPYVISCEVL